MLSLRSSRRLFQKVSSPSFPLSSSFACFTGRSFATTSAGSSIKSAASKGFLSFISFGGLGAVGMLANSLFTEAVPTIDSQTDKQKSDPSVSDRVPLAWKVTRDVIGIDDGKDAKIKTTVTHEHTGESFDHTWKSCNGVVMPIFVTQERYDWLKTAVKLGRGDVVVSTFPKCGTTWMEQIVLLLSTGGDESKLNPLHKNDYDPNWEGSRGKVWPLAALARSGEKLLKGPPISLEQFDAMQKPRVIKSHMPRNLHLGVESDGSLNPGSKVIVVTRNPKDACVSMYYHAWNPYEQGWSFDSFASLWLDGAVEYGSWHDWVKGWHQEAQNNPQQVLWIHYEDMQQDAHAAVRKVANFIGIDADDDLVNTVVIKSSFKSMKKQAVDIKKKIKSKRRSGHLRKGQVGDWRGHFSPALSAEFDDKYNQNFAPGEINYRYE